MEDWRVREYSNTGQDPQFIISDIHVLYIWYASIVGNHWHTLCCPVEDWRVREYSNTGQDPQFIHMVC